MRDMFGDDDSQNKKNDFATMFEASVQGYTQTYGKGDKVTAEVMTLGKDEVFVNISGRDGMVPRAEMLDANGQLKVQVGDQVTLYVVKAQEGLLVLSAKASGKALADDLEDAFDFETPVEGRVTEVVNGGFRVNVMGKLAFCPISQMDSKPITEPESYIDKKFDFMITKFEKGGRNIVVSRRRMLDMEKLENQGTFMDQRQVGEVMNGRVVRLENYGAFVELAPGIDGLVHISEVSWSRLAHPSEALEVGQEISVKILKIEEDATGRLKISLSRKQAEEDPWMTAYKDFAVGSVHTGKIRSKERFGFLMELKPGIVGLLPKSAFREVADEREMEKKNPGETLKVQIQNVNTVEKKISLSFPKDQEDTSWQGFTGSTGGAGSGKGLGTLADQFKNLTVTKKK
ncbi:S1 RNA-binding domain-containing protein [Bdellovibrio sp. HCB337]|uniref:S1 RNA-binding domain-containing protein n=1 Tax=Bdellovibrio sp. HCB337 TaxID=3394358 RepID=UPI0039A4ABE0